MVNCPYETKIYGNITEPLKGRGSGKQLGRKDILSAGRKKIWNGRNFSNFLRSPEKLRSLAKIFAFPQVIIKVIKL